MIVSTRCRTFFLRLEIVPREEASGDESFVVSDWAVREADGVEADRIARGDPWALPWGRGGVS